MPSEIIPIFILFAVVSIGLGLLRDRRMARWVGREVGASAPRPASGDDPVVLLEKLHALRVSGALTEAEYEAQKARILNGS